MAISITTPLDKETSRRLKAGDRVMISGVIYTARDAAHKKLLEIVASGQALPMELKGQIIYYAGPCPAKPGQIIGSIGPTTSGRMDTYTPTLLDMGLTGMIGKGQRSPDTVQAMIKNGAVYFAAIGGTGALLAQAVKKAELIAFPELGAEAIFRLSVENFPATVVIDSRGENLYINGQQAYHT